MAASFYNVEREQVLGQLRSGIEIEQLQGLARVADIGPSGALALDLAAQVAALVRSGSDQVQLSAIETLGSLEDVGAEFADAVAVHVKSKVIQKRCYAVGALGMMGQYAASFCTEVVECLRDQDSHVRGASCLALSSMGGGRFVAEVSKCLDDSVCDVVTAALVALPEMEPSEAKRHVAKVAEKLADLNKEVRHAALLYFAKFGGLAPQYAESICKLLEDEDCHVREAVVSVFGALQDKQESMVAVVAKTLSHQDPRFKAAAAAAIGATGAAAGSQVAALAALLQDTSEDKSQLIHAMAGIEAKAPCTVRIPACAAMSALAKIGDASFGQQVVDLLASENCSLDVRIMAATTLGDFGLGGDFESALLPCLHNPQVLLRAEAIKSVGKLAKKKLPQSDMSNQVAEYLVDKSPVVRAVAVEALGCMGDEGAAFTTAIVGLLDDRSAAVRASAARALAGVGVKGQLYAGELCRRMPDEGPQVKIACLNALADMGARGAAFADEVAALIADPDSTVRIAVLDALARMGGRDARQFFLQACEQAQTDKLHDVREAADALLSDV